MMLVAGDHQSSGLLIRLLVIPSGLEFFHLLGNGVVLLDESSMDGEESGVERVAEITGSETEIGVL